MYLGGIHLYPQLRPLLLGYKNGLKKQKNRPGYSQDGAQRAESYARYWDADAQNEENSSCVHFIRTGMGAL